jgi:hypothetical protein
MYLAVVNLKGIYRLELLAPQYAKLPGVESAEPDSVMGDGPKLCAAIAGDAYHYLFDSGSGDCPAGCIDHVFYYFVAAADGTIESRGTWDTRSGLPEPAWVGGLQRMGLRCHE